jgi:ubiquilin
MASEDATMAVEADPTITFKVKTSAEGNYTITMAETATVLDLKNKLAGDDYENVPAERQRLIYSGKVMKNEETLSTYKIKAGNTIHMVKSAQSNAIQNPASASSSPSGAPRAAAGVPTNMAAGTNNDPLAGLTGARYAGHIGLPGAGMFGADGGVSSTSIYDGIFTDDLQMGAPPSEDDVANMLSDPNMQQMMNEALNNPAMVDMMIQQNPMLRNHPHAREILSSPEFRQLMTNPQAMRQAQALRRMMRVGGPGGASAFPAPGATDTTPSGAASSNPSSPPPFNPIAAGGFGGAGGTGNPFAALFGQPPAGQTPVQTPPAPASAGQGTPGQGTPGTNNDANAANPFTSLFGPPGPGGQTQFQIPSFPPGTTPDDLLEALQYMRDAGMGGSYDSGAFAGAGGASSPPPPADTRPPEERYESQLRQLNDMGFFDFDRNVEALRRSGGSVQGAIEQLLR